METEVIITSIIIGYFLMGWTSLLKVQSASMIDKPGLMRNPNIFKKIYWVVAWPIHLYIETYYLHMPNKERAIVYGILTIPVMWLGFSGWGYLVVLPNLLIENLLLAFGASAVCVLLGGLILMPVIGVLCGMLLIAIAYPIVSFLPDRQKNV